MKQDVYKRQLSVFADLASLIWVSRTGTEVNNTVKSCWQAFIPVSYTHLDVYKRQPFELNIQ